MSDASQRVAGAYLAAFRYAYHGASARSLLRLQKHGLVPGVVSSGGFSDAYSEYDDGRHLFFSNDEGYIRSHYGDLVLRFPWPGDAKPDKNKFGRTLKDQFVSRKTVLPKVIEAKPGRHWVPLLSIR